MTSPALITTAPSFVEYLPTINSCFNLISATFLTLGFIAIKRGYREKHKKYMVSALISSALFLIGYVIYHYYAGSTKYPYEDWTRPIYFAILIPHIILAALMVPGILYVVWQAWKEQFERHRRLAKWVWPVWMFVSVSGVTIYLMLYRL